MPALSILIWLPARARRCSARCCRRAGRTRRPRPRPAATCAGRARRPALALLGALAALGLAIAYIADFKPGGGSQHVTDTMWISALGIHYKLARRRA